MVEGAYRVGDSGFGIKEAVEGGKGFVWPEEVWSRDLERLRAEVWEPRRGGEGETWRDGL